MPTPKAGALTQAEIFGLWAAALDRAYREPLVMAGEGEGLEAHTQQHAVMARASTAVDRTTQAMFILPWSGQTNPPAQGARKATVTLTFERTARVHVPMVLGKGMIFAEEQQTDWGPDGGVQVLTGRRYTLTEDLVFPPGERGPLQVPAIAEFVGDGHNNPMPGTIKVVSQPASQFENDHATVLVTPFVAPGAGAPSTTFVVTPNEPDTFVPEHVGQYLVFTVGANAGLVGRILNFQGADLGVFPPTGSTIQIEVAQAFETATFFGTFLPGEIINFGVANARGIVLGERVVSGIKRVTYVLTHAGTGADPAIGQVASGVVSSATATVEQLLYVDRFTAEAPSAPNVGGASWRIVPWPEGWGLTVTNELAPEGGVHGWLDELGSERAIYRAPGEPDGTYRKRVSTVADVVSPNAIRRALSRALGTLPWCFREVGTPDLRGFFYDGSGVAPGGAQSSVAAAAEPLDAYDTDVLVLTGTVTSGVFVDNEAVVLEELPGFLIAATGFFGRIDGGVTFTLIRKTGGLPDFTAITTRVRGLHSGATFDASAGVIPASVNARRFRYWLDYAEFRGFFLVGVPPLSLGEFGFAYDDFPINAYDASPYDAFYDGYPAGSAAIYSRVYTAVDPIRAGGVLWSMYVERIGCP